jgi:hypothetical protein
VTKRCRDNETPGGESGWRGDLQVFFILLLTCYQRLRKLRASQGRMANGKIRKTLQVLNEQAVSESKASHKDCESDESPADAQR